MRLNEAYSGKVFIASQSDFDHADAVIYGMPMDFTVSFRPGARFGPAKIREASIGLEEYSPYLDRSLNEIRYYDAGDLLLPFGNAERSLQMIRTYTAQLFQAGKFPLGLGGEHLITWPIVQSAVHAYPDLRIIHIDAHADLRDQYEGEPLSHSTPLRKIAEEIGGDRIYQFGIRSGAREEFDYGKQHTHLYLYDVLEPLQRILPQLGKVPV